MPRQGEGEVINDNSIEQGENLTHGTPSGGKDAPAGSGVDRSSKAAPAPDHEAGEGIGSSGQATVVGKGEESK